MGGRRIARLMLAHPDKTEINLQRRGPDQAGKLYLCLNFFWHQIEQRNPQRADILPGGLIFIHHHHALTCKGCIGRKRGGKFNRHT